MVGLLIGNLDTNSAARAVFCRGMSADISTVFPSLSSKKPEPLPDRFRDLKLHHIRGKEDAWKKSWDRLLASLKDEIKEVKSKGSEVSMVLVKSFLLPLSMKGDTNCRVLRHCLRLSETLLA